MVGQRHESMSLGVCQCGAMGVPGITVRPVDEGNSESAVRFLIEWVSDGEAEARTYLGDHAEPDGASLIATDGADVIGYVAIVWESDYAAFRSRECRRAAGQRPTARRSRTGHDHAPPPRCTPPALADAAGRELFSQARETDDLRSVPSRDPASVSRPESASRGRIGGGVTSSR
jgi:hypothetical protein